MGGGLVISCYVKMGSDNKRGSSPNSQISSQGGVVGSHGWHLEEFIGVGILKGLGLTFRFEIWRDYERRPMHLGVLHRALEMLSRDSRKFCTKTLKLLTFFTYPSLPAFCEVI
jgi:hypothetical protein